MPKKDKEATSGYITQNKEERLKLLAAREKELGILSHVMEKDVEKIQTGLMPLDYVVGGGIAPSSIIEIAGAEKSGKTTLATYIAYKVMEHSGLPIYYFDFERTLNPNWLSTCGVDVHELQNRDPSMFRLLQVSGTESLDIITKVVPTGAISCVVIDSLPTMRFDDEEVGHYQIGIKAKNQTDLINAVVNMIGQGRAETIFIIINQYRSNVTSYGSPIKNFGPMALFYSNSYQLDINMLSKSKGGFIEENDMIVGNSSRLLCKKNKYGEAYLESQVNFYFPPRLNPGISYSPEELVAERGRLVHKPSGLDIEDNNAQFFYRMQMIQRKGSWYAWKDGEQEISVQGLPEVTATFKKSPKLMYNMIDEFWKREESYRYHSI